MAAWRKISRDLATSERFNQLTERARLVYFQAYPFADRDGLLPGSPTKLLAMAFPIANIPPDAIDTAAVELVGARLWELLFDANERPVYRILRFVEYQGSGHLAREAPSKFISPLTSRSSSIEFDAIAGELPSEERRGEEMRGEESENAPARAKSEERAKERSSPQEISGSRRQEVAMMRVQIIADFQEAHPMGKDSVIRPKWDDDGILAGIHALTKMTDRVGFFRRALASLPPDRQTLEAAIGCLNNPAIVNGPRSSFERRNEVDDLHRARATDLGITVDELRKQYESGRMSFPQRPATAGPIPVLPEEESVDPARLVGMERVGAIVARAISPSRKDLE